MTDLIFSIGHPHPDRCPIHNTIAKLLVGEWGPYYRCSVQGCTVTGSAHEDGRPQGKLATKEIAEKRDRAHKIADQLLYLKGWRNTDFYTWVKSLHLPNGVFHIGDMFDQELNILVREMQREMKR